MDEYMILIPAYQPNDRFLDLIRALKDKNIGVLAVNDGSGAEYAKLFEEANKIGAMVLQHESNRGKGAAIKTGIDFLMQNENVLGIVTADADGQHTVTDIMRVIEAMKGNPDTFVIGARSFIGNVPARSRFGNSVTCAVFKFATGLKISDTQTGLRGLPKTMFKALVKLSGDRYEYEMNMLLNLQRWGVKYVEIPIETVYIDENSSSHFHPLRDSWRIYLKIIKFCASSFVSFLIDYALYALFGSVLHIVPWLSYVSARIVSSYANYVLNRHIVFGGGKKGSLWQYYLLVLVAMVIGSGGVSLLTWLGIHSIIAKLMIDIPLFFMNYIIQRKYIFKPHPMGQ